jgi:hypothetical protein
VGRTQRQPPEIARLLRLGWRARFDDVESKSPAELRTALEGRNFSTTSTDPIALDDLLPLPIESEPRWRARRAATEVIADPSTWFVRYGDLVLPDQANAGALNGAALVPGLLRALTGEGPASDPLPSKLRGVAAKGGAGAVLTRLEIAGDLAGVQVESMLWVRLGDSPDAWQPAVKRLATVRTDQLRANADAAIKADPQVQAVFNLVEGLGLGEMTPEIKQRALSIGAATQQALNQAKAALNEELQAIAVPLSPGR